MPVRIQGNCSFGRAATNQVVLADERVSRCKEAIKGEPPFLSF
jgi:hypothetical protein